MQKHEPRAVKSYIPAGSAWFCEVKTAISMEDLLKKLHGQCIGAETEWGRGQILIGVWHDKDTKTQG
jgi:CRISPR-associated protein Cmr3